MGRISRRAFLATAAETTALAATAAVLRPSNAAAAVSMTRVDALPSGITRSWLGPQYWANRLADWRLHNGRIECLKPAGAVGTRSVC